MRVIVGKYAGFCPGVMNSVTKAEEAVDKYDELYCLGELIHNKTVVCELENNGMKTVEDINEVPDNSVVIFRAHGVKESIYIDAKNKNLNVIDLTCAIVKSIHDKVSVKKHDNFIIITGDSFHPETIGTKDFAGINSCVVSEDKDIEKAYEEFIKSNLKKVYVISQTTFSLRKFEELSLLIQDKFKDYEIEINNSICKATELRQKEVEDLSKENDVVVVVGGKNSSNTKKLYDISKKNCNRAYHIETILELENESFNDDLKVAIVAGASTPKKVINEVEDFFIKKEGSFD